MSAAGWSACFGACLAQVLDVTDRFGEEARDVIVEELVADASSVAVVAHEAEVAQQTQLM